LLPGHSKIAGSYEVLNCVRVCNGLLQRVIGSNAFFFRPSDDSSAVSGSNAFLLARPTILPPSAYRIERTFFLHDCNYHVFYHVSNKHSTKPKMCFLFTEDDEKI
jgi:hypothetical protein